MSWLCVFGRGIANLGVLLDREVRIPGNLPEESVGICEVPRVPAPEHLLARLDERRSCIDGLLEPRFAAEVSAAYPTFERALELGRSLDALNESLKVQICDASAFPEPVARLNAALASPEWLEAVAGVSGIPKLLADERLAGGGMHVMGERGRLDVHVDFNMLRDRTIHRRLNILIFLNEGWRDGWGGEIELWDADVTHCITSLTPLFNRCVVFATSEESFHGVTKVRCPADRARCSFAGYYYTDEPPRGWSGQHHSTVFRARPNEWLRGSLLMPAQRASRTLRRELRRVARRLLRRP